MESAHSPYRRRHDAIEVTVSLCLCYTLCFFFVGVYLRVKSGSFKWDDIVAFFAAILSLGQFATQYIALSNGQGRSATYLATSDELNTLNALSRAGVILFFLTLYCSKAAGIALTYRFAPLQRHKLTVFVAFGFTLLLGIVSVLLLNVSCGLTGNLYWHLSRGSAQCSSQYMRWQLTTAFDIITEILVLLVPVDMIWSLQMRTKAKLGVLGRFWIRLPVLLLAIGRLIYIRNLLSANDVGTESGLAIIMHEVEMSASLSATVIITLRPFAKEFDTGFGIGGEGIAAYGITQANKSSGMASSGSRGGGLGSKIAGRLGISSKRGSRSRNFGNSALRSRNEKDYPLGEVVELNERSSRRLVKTPKEASESVRGLTDDVIMQTIDYKVEYEDHEPRDGARSSGGHNRV